MVDPTAAIILVLIGFAGGVVAAMVYFWNESQYRD